MLTLHLVCIEVMSNGQHVRLDSNTAITAYQGNAASGHLHAHDFMRFVYTMLPRLVSLLMNRALPCLSSLFVRTPEVCC